MAIPGIASIDALAAGVPGAVLANDRQSVGAVQELLIGHGFSDLPRLLDPAYGLFGPRTAAAVRGFQAASSLPVLGVVDVPTFAALVTVPAVAPLASRPYSVLVLDVPFTGIMQLAAVTTEFEGGGYFCATNLNTDRAGLSFGIVQWAQRPGRLNELLLAFQRAESALFTTIFGGGDQALAQSLLQHTARPYGGVDPVTGLTIDPRFDLVNEPWRSRFETAGRTRALQRVQLSEAAADFAASVRRIQASLPIVTTERALAFMLDVANQFGDGGAYGIAQAVLSPGMTESDFLLAAQTESVARVAREYGADSAEAHATLSRRQAIRTTPCLADAAIAI